MVIIMNPKWVKITAIILALLMAASGLTVGLTIFMR